MYAVLYPISLLFLMLIILHSNHLSSFLPLNTVGSFSFNTVFEKPSYKMPFVQDYFLGYGDVCKS